MGSVDEDKKQFDIITTFSKDVNMNFGLDKSAYMYVERDKRKYLNEEIEVNGIRIKELKEDAPYKYLGVDGTIGYEGELTEGQVTKEYLNRIRKIWKSELNSYNKQIKLHITPLQCH